MDERRFDAMAERIGAALASPVGRRTRLKQALGLAVAGMAAGAARASAARPIVDQPSARLQRFGGHVGGTGGRGDAVSGPAGGPAGGGPVGGTGGAGLIADPSERLLRLHGADGACNAKGGKCGGDGDCCGDLVCLREQTNPGWISYCG